MSAFNGSGTFVITGTGLPYVTATTISSTVANQLNTDLATGLSTCITKDGQTTPTGNIPIGGFKVTGIGAATATGDALSYGRAAKVTTLWQSSRNATYANLPTNSISVAASTPGIMGGIGTTWVITPSFSGRIKVIVTGTVFCNTNATSTTLTAKYGTGTAPVASAAITGTTIGSSRNTYFPANNSAYPFSIYGEATGLTLSTAYWLDIAVANSTGATVITECTVLVEEF